MPAIPSFINYKPAWKAKAIKSLTRFNRSETATPSTPDAPPAANSPAVSAVLDIKDDSSMDFDGGQPNEFEKDVFDKTSQRGSASPSNLSSTSGPEKLEVSLPPELRIDWFAEKFTGVPSNARKGKTDTNPNTLDLETRNMLAGKLGDDQGLVQTLEDALSLRLDSNPSNFISGLDMKLPEFSPTISKLSPGPLTIPNGPLDSGVPKHPRDSITMLTSRHSLGDTPASSALSGTTLARALISNTFAMPVDRHGEGGLARSDSSVLPRDSVYRLFPIAPDAPPMPPDAETQYVAPKRPRAERRKQMKRRSSTGTLSSKALPDIPGSSRRASLILSVGPEFGTFLKSPRPWSSDTAPVSSPTKSIPSIAKSTTNPTLPEESIKSDGHDSFALPTLPEGVRRLPDPRSQPSSSAGVSPSLSTLSSTPSRELDTKGLEDVLDFYNLGDSPGSFLSGTAFRLGFSPIREETGSQPLSANRNDRRDSKRAPPVGARSPRSRGDSMQLAARLSDARPLSKQMLMLLPSQNGSSAGLSERSGSLKSNRSFEPMRSDSASSYSQDTRSHSGQKTQLRTSSWAETSSPGGDTQRSIDDSDSHRNVVDDAVSTNNSSGRVSQSEGNHATNTPQMNLNTLPPIPITPIEVVRHNQPGAHSQLSEPSQTGLAAPSSSATKLPVSPLLMRSNSLPIDGANLSPTFATSTTSHIGPVNGGSSSTNMTVEKSVFTSRQPAASDHLYKDDFLGRNSTLSMGSPPPYYEVVNQTDHHHHHHHHHDHVPPTINNAGHTGPTDPVAGPSRSSGEWSTNESRRDGQARARIRPRPPLPIGPRRPSQGLVTSIGFPDPLQRSESMASLSRRRLSSSGQQPSSRLPAIRSPKFQTPPPKWRGHTMDAARWTFKSGQLQAIVSKAIRQSSEASLIRLLEPETLENDIPAEIDNLETIRTDIKTRYKLLARRRAVLFEGVSSSLTGTANPAEDGPGYAHRLLEELSEIAAMMDHLSEELHSADTQLAHLDSLTQIHTSSALAVALRKLNTSFLKQMAENEDIRNDLFSVEAERDEAWLQAERIAIEMDQLAGRTENPSPIITSNRSSRVSAHRKSLALASKAGLKIPKRKPSKRLSLKVTPSSTAFSSPFISPASSSKGGRPGKPVHKQPVPISTESTSLSPPGVVYSPSSATRAFIQAQDEIYTMLGLSAPGTSLQRSRSWTSLSASPPDSVCPSLRHSLSLLPPSERRTSLPPDSTLAQVSNAMAADRRAMLVTFDILSVTDNDDDLSR